MARPTKQGLSYFPLDTNFDEKTELFIIENGADGLGILITVWQMIYDNEGYYIGNGDDLFLLIRKRILSDVERIKEVVNNALERGLFDKRLHDKYKILTSKAIQKRYFIGSNRKKSVNVIKEYTLIDVSDCENVVNVSNNATNVKEDIKVNVKLNNKMDVDLFEKFWSQYPRKENKKKARDKFLSLKKDLFDKIIHAINQQRKSDQWTKDGGKYIPLPSTWLNGARWEDELTITNNRVPI